MLAVDEKKKISYAGLSLMTCLLVASLAPPLVEAQVQNTANLTETTDAKAPRVITLRDAIERAKANDPKFRSAVTELGLAHQDVVQSRASLLPNLNYNMEYIYTQGGGSPDFAGGRYIANNGVHEYIAQGNVHQILSPGMLAEHRAVEAAEAVARAKSEVAVRGLVVTVVEAYEGFVVAQRKYANTQRAVAEADHFLDISQKLEKGGEVANSDVIKARIQAQTQQRGLQDATLSMSKSRLDLAVLLFPNFDENFSVVDDLGTPEPLPSLPEVSATATKNNPELHAAWAALRQSAQQVKSAWAGMLPSLAADYFYGIDANQFAARDPNGFHNLGYSATATLQLPVWNWGSGYSKVKQADLRRQQAHVELSAVQRQLLANLKADYEEAQTSREELDSLRQSAELAAESLRLTTLRYQAGESSVLEVVDAQNTLTQARNAYDDGQLRFQVALANLQTLTGSF
ncbi:MAG TPA: TolC family protein [Terriglobales bacterium]|nr:TolC family protein [Terriglobales bacterium]